MKLKPTKTERRILLEEARAAEKPHKPLAVYLGVKLALKMVRTGSRACQGCGTRISANKWRCLKCSLTVGVLPLVPAPAEEQPAAA